MNACAACREQIELRMDGMLEAALAAQLDSHLSQCTACRRYDEAQQALTGNLNALSRVAESLAAPQNRETSTAPRWIHAGKVAAALAFVVLCTWTFVRRPSTKPDIAPAPVASDTTLNDPKTRPPVRLAVSVELIDAETRFAIPIATENPRVHMVWLYDDALPVADASPASAPSS